ncbi:MAG: DNA repair protein [Clostridia bacterium]|nr:DNA repair protein [Clostridia bacterium]
MTEKELKRLRRADLLELLIEQTQENLRLRQELEEARAKLADRAVRIERSGSLAEAAMQLSGVFEAAQDACSRYIENIRLRSLEEESHRDRLLDTMQERCGDCPRWREIIGSKQERGE